MSLSSSERSGDSLAWRFRHSDRLWSAHHLVGVGFHQFVELADPSRVAHNAGHGAVVLGSVHNEYMATLLKGGLIVMALLLVLLTTATRRFRTATR